MAFTYHHTAKHVVLKFKNDIDGTEKAWVGVDRSSGGYPYGEHNVLLAEDFKTEEAALKYAKHFQAYPLAIQQKAFIVIITADVVEAS